MVVYAQFAARSRSTRFKRDLIAPLFYVIYANGNRSDRFVDSVGDDYGDGQWPIIDILRNSEMPPNSLGAQNVTRSMHHSRHVRGRSMCLVELRAR